MNLRFCGSVLFVKDIKSSRFFYEALLGQKVGLDFGLNVSFGYFALWQTDAAFEIIHRNPRHEIGTGDEFELYFESPDIVETYNKIQEYGVVFVNEMTEQPWGQMSFRFYDPDHYLVEIGEAMSAVNARLFRSGMSIQEIAAKTHMPEETVKADIDKFQS
jgi:catechol 2,3-dioxygenase-like lactoylglutathione lyase family enzyme